jgi:ABC-type nitrate/sulfonate/bicarbonate transport system permease component
MDFLEPLPHLDPTRRRLLGLGSVVGVVMLLGCCWRLQRLLSKNQLPSPWSVARRLLPEPGTKARASWPWRPWSVGRVAAASLLVMIVGIPMGILMGASPKVDAVLSPLVDPFRSAPVAALLPIMVMWFGIGEGMKIAFCLSAPSSI